MEIKLKTRRKLSDQNLIDSIRDGKIETVIITLVSITIKHLKKCVSIPKLCVNLLNKALHQLKKPKEGRAKELQAR